MTRSATSFTIKQPLLVDQKSGLRQATSLTVVDGRIASGPAEGELRFDAEGLIVTPGYIDLQINGGFGTDLWSEPAALWDLGRRLPETGTTAFYPTLISPDQEQVAAAQAALANRPTDYVGAEPLGWHLEGPMLSPQRRGIHRSEALTPADEALIAQWRYDTGVHLVTLAPEVPGADEVIAQLRKAGVVVAAGHSAATADQAARAESQGVSMVTHLFNAMNQLHHRQPGLVGYTLASRTLRAGIIADGHHVDETTLRIAWQLLGPDRLAVVSDAVAALGSAPGNTVVAGCPAIADEDTVRDSEGKLAGARASMALGVQNLVRLGGANKAGALGAASRVPAQIMNLPDRGHLRIGAHGDVTLLDSSLAVVAVLCGGRLAYLKPGFEDRLSGTTQPRPTTPGTPTDATQLRP